MVSGEEWYAGSLSPSDGMNIAQSAATVLEIGFEKKRNFSRFAVARADTKIHLIEPTLCPLLPEFSPFRCEFVSQLFIASQITNRQNRCCGIEIIRRQRQRLFHGSHGMTHFHALIPNRIPNAFG